ncbi:DUF2157 domain-containing protein [Leptospira sp. 96542]|nr:DUF2157 domain-containing protein [Leptospira sp. 96542]
MVEQSIEDWYKIFKRSFLFLGISLLVSGIIFLFAFNWNELHRYVKLSIVLVAYGLSNILYLVFRNNSLLKESLLVVIFFLTATVFFVFGQIYQTGADAYDLFLGWLIFTFALNFLSTKGVIWGLWLALGFFTLFLFTDQVYVGESEALFYLILGLVYSGILSAYERYIPSNHPSKPWFGGYTVVIILTLFFIGSLFVNNGYGFLKLGKDSTFLPFVFLPTILGLFFYFYRYRKPKLVNLTIILIFILFYVNNRLYSVEASLDSGLFLLSFLFTIGYTVFCIQYLLKFKNSLEAET